MSGCWRAYFRIWLYCNRMADSSSLATVVAWCPYMVLEMRLVRAQGVRLFQLQRTLDIIVFPALLFFLDGLLLPSFLAHCAALYATPWGSQEVVRQIYTAVLWRTCMAYCLGRALLWGGQRALHRLDALYREVRASDQYVRSERLLNRGEAAAAGGATEVL
jgi:hypothetical protein